MRIQSISANVYGQRLRQNSNVQKVTPIDKPTPVPSGGFWISFSGAEKNANQILSITPEDNYLGGIYKAGGLGCVADEAPEALKTSGKDVRSISPYYSYGDDKGQIYVLQKDKKGNVLDDYIKVNQDYKLKDGESFALITDVDAEKNIKRGFLLDDLDVSGSVKRMKVDEIDMETVPYRTFKISKELKKAGGDFVDARSDVHYIVHTPYQAKGQRVYGVYDFHKASAGTGAYGGTATGVASKHIDLQNLNCKGINAGDLYYTDFTRSILASAEKLAEKDGFNPRNYWVHDRFGYAIIPELSQRANRGEEFFKGMRIASVFHNPGRAYQGVYSNPLDFFRVVATEDDFNRLKARKDFDIIKQMNERIVRGNGIVGKDAENLDAVFRSAYVGYTDDFGFYNVTKIPIHHTKVDPEHFTLGTVSNNFGKEMVNMDTEEIAEGLTKSLKDVEAYTNNITNGSRPANMATDAKAGFFGTGRLNEIFKDENNVGHYTPYSKADDVSTRYAAKKANKTNLLNIIHDAVVDANKEGGNKDAVADLFFNQGKKNGLRGKETGLKLSLGALSKYEEGDILMIGWGRPDPQKGMPVTLQGFKEFLKDESVPLETRKHTKLILGAGSGDAAFHLGNREWDLIQKEIKEIGELQGGAFKNNALYINGLFPNRLANCADVAIFSSRYEPCGITPFESFAAGCPVISTNTGGAPDFIREGETGFLTKDPFKLSAEKLGLDTSKIPANEFDAQLDAKRSENIASQLAEKIKVYVTGYSEETQKGFIERTMNEKIAWNENGAYNGGKNAVDRLSDETFVMGKTLSSNNYNHEEKAFGRLIERIIDKPHTPTGWSKGKIALVSAAVIAAGAGVYYFLKNSKKSETKAITPQYVNNQNRNQNSRYQQQLRINA